MKAIHVFILFLILSSCGEKKAVESTVAETRPLVVGMELAYPPFETKDALGNPTGVSVEIAKELGKFLDREIIIENIAWNGLIPSLQTGKVDFIISSMTITEERKKQVSFSDPYAQVLLSILANTNANITSYDQLNDPTKTIAVKQGTTAFFFAKQYFPTAKINSFTSESTAITEVAQGKADAFIYGELTVYKAYLQNPSHTTIITIPAELQDSSWGIAVNKENTKLLADINRFLASFLKSETKDNLIQTYLQKEKELADKFGFKFIF
ncbi:MAG: transporter substrate-binding domain-containing protein [Brevinema sp.]